jgi:hypothetical protein
MDGSYSAFTLADAWGDLGGRLYDPDHVRWTTDELTIYVQQALRTFNALTNHFRSEATFQTATPEAFYDLPTVLPSLRAQNFTVLEAVNQICYQLLEPVPNAGLWVGTQQYSVPDILSALQQARDDFLFETGIVQTRRLIDVASPATTGRIALPEAIANLRRLAWKTDDGIITLLRRDDQWGLTNYQPNWQTVSAAPPKIYSVSTQPPLVVQLAPPTSVGATLDLVSVDQGEEVSLSIAGQSLGVPNDWAWVVIFGALSQLLQRDGLAQDAARADYFQQRFEHGLKMARTAAVVLSARVNDVQCNLGALADADAYTPSWQLVPSIPARVLTAGHTVIALNPPPGVPTGGGNFTILLQLVRNAPVPTLPADPLQIGGDLVNDILDYAQHLAISKEGAFQIQLADSLLKRFFSTCGVTLAIQYASQPEEPAAANQTAQDSRVLSYRGTDGS